MHEAPERRAEALRAGKLAAVGGVRDMVWVHSNGVGLLAVAQDPGTLLLLNPCDGSQVWKREWQETICCLTRDPLNYSQIALCTDQVRFHGSGAEEKGSNSKADALANKMRGAAGKGLTGAGEQG